MFDKLKQYIPSKEEIKKPRLYLPALFGLGMQTSMSISFGEAISKAASKGEDISGGIASYVVLTGLNAGAMKFLYSAGAEMDNYKSPKPLNMSADFLSILGRGAARISLTSLALAVKTLIYLGGVYDTADYYSGKVLKKLFSLNATSERDRYFDHYSDDSPSKYANLAAIYYLYGDEEKSIKNITEWIKNYQFNDKFKEILNENFLGAGGKSKKRLLSRKFSAEFSTSKGKNLEDITIGRNYYDFMTGGLYRLSSGDIEAAKSYFIEAIKRSESKEKNNLGIGLLLHNLGKEQEGIKIIKKTIEEHPEIFDEAEYMVGSKRAKKLKDNFFGNVIFIQEGAKENLEEEIENILRFKNKIKEYRMQGKMDIAEPIGIIAENNADYLVTMYKEGILEKDIYIKSRDAQKLGFEANAFFHAVMTEKFILDDQGEKPYLSDVSTKLEINDTLSPNLKSMIMENITASFSLYPKNPFLVWDGDRSPYQAIYTKTKEGWKKTFIDLETKNTISIKGYNRPESDDAKNLFHGMHLVQHKHAKDFLYDQLKRKVEIFNTYSEIPELKLDSRFYTPSVLATAIYKAITYTLYSHTLSNPRADARKFLTMAVFAVEAIKHDLSDHFTFKNFQKLKNMGECLELLIEENESVEKSWFF